MKKLLFILIASVISFSAMAQELGREASKSEFLQFINNEGAFFKKEFYHLKKLHNIEIQVLIYTDMVSNEKNGCLRIRTTSTNSRKDYIGTLDYNELQSCIEKIKYITETVMAAPPKVYTEWEFKTKDRVSIGTFWSERTQEWNFYINPVNAIDGTIAYISKLSVPTIVESFEEAFKILDAELK